VSPRQNASPRHAHPGLAHACNQDAAISPLITSPDQPSSGATTHLGHRVSRSTLVTLGGYGTSQVLRMASNLVLAYILAPADFGLMVLVNVFIQSLSMFSDLGVGPSIIQNKRGDDPRFLDTAWTMQVGRGLCLAAASWLAAPLVARWYEEPRLTVLIPVAGLTAIIAGFESTKLSTAVRHMQLGRRTVIDLVAQVVSMVFMITWALYSPTVWSLIAGGIANSLTKAVLSHLALPGHNNRFGFDKAAYGELVAFGKWIFVSTAITFFATQIDRLVLGHLVPLDQLGVYGTAQQLAALPMMITAMMAGAIVYPVLSAAARSDPSSLGALTQRIREVLLPCGLFTILGLALLAPSFFRMLYDERYVDAGWIVVGLMLPLWFMILTQSADRTLLALGDTRALAVCNASALAGKLLGCLVGFRLGGLQGFILGLTVGTVAGHLVVQWTLRQHGIAIWRQDARYTLLALALGVIAVLLPRAVIAELGERWRTPVEIAVALLVLVPAGPMLWRHVRRNWPRT